MDSEGREVRRGQASGTVAASPDTVFRAVVDIDRLPEWNTIIKEVVERPETLAPGAVWKVRLRPAGMPSWVSASEVLELDREGRRFRYRSRTDDGNPSFGTWEWTVRPAPAGSEVVVGWELRPKTFMRKHLLSKVRQRALRREVEASISSLGRMAAADERGASTA